jgi:hypothetical protein
VEEMKKMYGTERGSHRIIIKRISNAATMFSTKLMACKLLRNFPKEEVPIMVVAAVAQCPEGTILIWAPYLLNMFLEDYKDMQDLGTEFHYSFLLILIALIGWREPKYTYFCERNSHCRATRYILLGSTSDSKSRSENASMFVGYYNDLQ